jgi:hypothetical protein
MTVGTRQEYGHLNDEFSVIPGGNLDTFGDFLCSRSLPQCGNLYPEKSRISGYKILARQPYWFVVGFLVLNISVRPSLGSFMLAFCNSGSRDPCNPRIPSTGPDPGKLCVPCAGSGAGIGRGEAVQDLAPGSQIQEAFQGNISSSNPPGDLVPGSSSCRSLPGVFEQGAD